MAVLVFTERLRESREVVFHRWYHQQPAGAGEVPSGPYQREIVGKGAVPPSTFPRDGPARTAGVRRALLDLHLGLVDRPRRHGPRAGLVLGDHCLEHRERQSGRSVVLELPRVERQLARTLADGMRNELAQVAGREIDAIRVAHMCREVARQLPLEPIEILLELRTHGRVD